jgi:hypothetical protein
VWGLHRVLSGGEKQKCETQSHVWCLVGALVACCCGSQPWSCGYTGQEAPGQSSSPAAVWERQMSGAR